MSFDFLFIFVRFTNTVRTNYVFTEKQKFREFIDRKLRNKENFNKWQDKYTEANADLREPKQLLREESRKTIEQLEREKEDNRQSAEKRSK